ACTKPSSEGRLHNDQTKLVNTGVTYRVQEYAVGQGIWPTHHSWNKVMVMPAGVPRDSTPAQSTKAALRLVERLPLLAVTHAVKQSSSLQRLSILLILGIEGVEAALDLEMPVNRSGGKPKKLQPRLFSGPCYVSSGKHPAPRLCRGVVPSSNPASVLAGVPPPRPTPDRPENQVIHTGECLLGYYGAVIVCPSP